MISLHEGGMREIGEQYKTLIELTAQRTVLSSEQIKVTWMISVKNLNLIITYSLWMKQLWVTCIKTVISISKLASEYSNIILMFNLGMYYVWLICYYEYSHTCRINEQYSTSLLKRVILK